MQTKFLVHNPRKEKFLDTIENRRSKNIRRQKIKDKIIKSIYNNHPAGILHLAVIAKILKQKIQVYKDDYLIGTFNERSPTEIRIQYTKSKGTGHWVLKGGKNPSTICSGGNNCLYEVIGSQTGWNPVELRYFTAKALRRDRYAIGKYMDADTSDNLMLGGARYAGRSPRDAGYILDASQNGQCHPEGRSGHPRGHTSNGGGGGGGSDSVEAYSYGRWRSGFLSRGDQDLVAHYALITDSAQRLMNSLNRGENKVAENIGRSQLDYDPLPMAQIWDRGQKQGSPGQFNYVTLVGKHFLNRQNDANADVFVLTFYPVL
ncbi:uncharacterized protein LOC106636496 [Copidosoma floridanum]|uniref:uncharacterized protein LOC106636496 n=1 Tax=Copidosoma floridanum TaxID=29053 RepID=UPI0006C9A7B2|nr:uncharacterized protein LOC106636496 [Copidosoma floridanum]